MLEITDTARDKLKEILGQNEGKYLRLYVQGLGWGGPKIGMALDEPEEDENTHMVNGIDVLVKEPLVDLVENTTIDYVYESGAEGFIMTGQDDSC